MRSFGRALIIFLLGGVLGTGFGVALGFFFFPFVFPPPTGMEQLLDQDRSPLVAAGTFIHANPSDPIHWGRGKVSVYERAVFLEQDFEVGPGPAFHVLLVPRVTSAAPPMSRI
jgi:ABC-type antimicrobial peptide transport system permease subunit